MSATLYYWSEIYWCFIMSQSAYKSLLSSTIKFDRFLMRLLCSAPTSFLFFGLRVSNLCVFLVKLNCPVYLLLLNYLWWFLLQQYESIVSLKESILRLNFSFCKKKKNYVSSALHTLDVLFVTRLICTLIFLQTEHSFHISNKFVLNDIAAFILSDQGQFFPKFFFLCKKI